MRAHMSSSAIIDSPANEVYGVLADYRDGHPHILPRQFFSSLDVLSGGHGTGTRFRVGTRVLGIERTLEMDVTEPEPGRLLRETEPATGLQTSFLVEPLDHGRRSRVTISTAWEPKPGIAGRIERIAAPWLLRWVYRAELSELARFMAARRR
jgi:hypothetical protein